MIFMVTNRRFTKGEYRDEEQPNYRFDYLSDHLDATPGNDGFAKNDKRAFQAALLKSLLNLRETEGVSTPKVGIYLHGYNNDWQESIDELVDLHAALTPIVGYPPVLIGFSWPSAGKTRKYLADREEVRDSVPAFTRFLVDIHEFLLENERDCFSTSFCISHSMGNYLLRKGMEYLSDHLGTPLGRKMFDETLLLAPDLASGDIEKNGKGAYIAQFSRRVHVYYSKHDRALKASSTKRFGGNRLGRHGANDYENLSSNVILVNAEKYANSESVKDTKLKDRLKKKVSVHSSHRYHPSILADIGHVLSSRDRDSIPTRTVEPKTEHEKANHYVLI